VVYPHRSRAFAHGRGDSEEDLDLRLPARTRRVRHERADGQDDGSRRLGRYVSGHDVDKWQAAEFTAVEPAKISVPLIGEAIGNVEYKVVKQIPFDDGMDLFVGEVLATHIRKGVMEGEIYREGSNPLLYLGTKFDAEGKSLGKYYAHFSGVGRADYDAPLLKKYLSQAKKRNAKKA
jgi:Flavin reductase like domain